MVFSDLIRGAHGALERGTSPWFPSLRFWKLTERLGLAACAERSHQGHVFSSHGAVAPYGCGLRLFPCRWRPRLRRGEGCRREAQTWRTYAGDESGHGVLLFLDLKHVVHATSRKEVACMTMQKEKKWRV